MNKSKLVDLLQTTGALKFGEFQLASGKKSNYYVDAKALSLHGVGLNVVTRKMADLILEHYPETNCVGGPELGAIPLLGALLMHIGGIRDVAGFIVRKEIKAYGTKKIIEGPITPESHHKVIVVEDVCTTGGSVLKGVKALREAGHKVQAVFCIVDRQEGAQAAFDEAKVPLYSLLTATDILNVRE